MKSIIAATVVVASMTTLTASAETQMVKTEQSVAMEKTLKISGMKCPHGCGGKVRAALSGLEGVTVNKVWKGGAKLTVTDDVTDKQIVRAIKKVGFRAKVKK